MRYFQQIAQGVDTLPLLLDLFRQPALWDQNPARTAGGPFIGTSDIWCRFRDPGELTGAASYAEPFIPQFWPAWHALPHLRPLVMALMTRMEAVQLGLVLITRVPPGGQVAPHHDRGRWAAEFYGCKVAVPLSSNDRCTNTCEDERVVMHTGEAWLFENQVTHSTVNEGESDRITLIVTMRVE